MHRFDRAFVLAVFAGAGLLPVAMAGDRTAHSAEVATVWSDRRLTSAAATQVWAAVELRQQLKLHPREELAIVGPRRHLRDWSVYPIMRSVNGIPVEGWEARLLVDSQGWPRHLLGLPNARPSASEAAPTIDLVDAVAAAGNSIDTVVQSRLVYWPIGSELALAYGITGAIRDSRVVVERLYIDARAGAVLERVPLVHGARARKVYDFESACRSEGVRGVVGAWASDRLLRSALQRHLVRSEGSPTSGRAQVDEVFDLLGKLYQFFDEVLELDSFDDRGSPMRTVANTRYSPPDPNLPQCVGDEFNAFWVDSLEAAVFPVGVSAFPEIVGHEFTHAIISSGSRLIYKHEPGALNEAIADAVGVGFRAWLEMDGQLDAPVPDAIWRVRDPDGVLRDLQNPRRVGNLPNHYSDYRLVRGDHAGVHINSSIINQGFYLLAAGGRHPDITASPEVRGIGLASALKIFGRAGSNLLTPNSDFRDARYAFALAAEILFGEQSNEWIATHTAMDAIGIPGRWVRPTDPGEEAETPARSQPSMPPEPKPVPTGDERPERAGEPELPPESPAEPDTTRSQGQPPQAPPHQTRDAVVPGPSRPPSPRPPSDASTEGQSPKPADESKRPPDFSVIVAGAIVLFLIALVLVMNRSRTIEGGTSRTVHSIRETNTSEGASTMAAYERKRIGALVALDGSSSIPLNKDLLLSPEGLVVGRAVDLCHVEIRDPGVSRRHVRCRLVSGALWVEDLHSIAGTQVNGIPIKPFVPTLVHKGQVLRIGERSYRLALADDA